MKTPGYFDEHYEPVAPFVEVMIVSSSLGLQKMIDFHIDTGASVTLLLDKDVENWA